ncbi:MAG: DUF2339 domain-containing protein [Betaproteobacteria bacterium]|nr:MAG: DUF2339 domain-containing protein [Betaproteobacteria bacterium]
MGPVGARRRRTDRRRPAAARRTPQPATTVAASGCGALGRGGVGDRVVGQRAAARAAPPTSTARGAVAVADVAQRLADSDLGGDGRDRALARLARARPGDLGHRAGVDSARRRRAGRCRHRAVGRLRLGGLAAGAHVASRAVAPTLKPLHVAGFWLFLWLAARECQLWMESLGASDSAWATLGWVLAPAAVLTLITRPALLRRWPLVEHRDTYLGVACTPVALYLLLWLWVGNAESGSASLLPYVPLLNPLELGQGLVLLVLMLWLRALPTSLQQHLPRPALLGTLGATAFALYTGMVLRICHHWAGVGWSGTALFASTLTQAALSVAWSVVGVALMLVGHRRGRRIVWVVGAALLGVVVAKLFLVELADRGGLYRIVSFIVVGVLLLVVGYFAPIPPKRDGGDARRAAASVA